MLWSSLTPLLLLLSARGSQADRLPTAAVLLREDQTPLSTSGRYIVDNRGARVKWACVNWAGSSNVQHVVGGLDTELLEDQAKMIADLGFNCVRLPYSTQGWVENPLVDDADVKANPKLKGKRFKEVFDETVQALTGEGLMVIINHHTYKAGWCCDQNSREGLGTNGAYGFTKSQWLDSLTGLAERYINNTRVVAFDVINEPHGVGRELVTWGDGGPNDVAKHQEEGGNAVLTANPNLLIVVASVCFSADLRPVKDYQVQFKVPNRLVYEMHNYLEFNGFKSLAVKLGPLWKLHFPMLMCLMLIVICMLALVFCWGSVGAPRAPPGLMILSIGLWIFFPALIVTIFATLVVNTVGHLCAVKSTWADVATDVFLLDPTLTLAIVSLTAIAFVALGVHMSRREDDEEDNYREMVPLEANNTGEKGNKEDYKCGCVPAGFDSFRLLHSRLKRRQVGMHIETPLGRKATWDCGVCLGLQCFLACWLIALILILLLWYTTIASSYHYLQHRLDQRWGFALVEGHPYTAPVWLGEVGAGHRSEYWLHMLQYMSDRDVDWSYWPWNGQKFVDGYYLEDGTYVKMENAKWENDTFGILDEDPSKIRRPWRLLDLQAIMQSPASYVPRVRPCDPNSLTGDSSCNR